MTDTRTKDPCTNIGDKRGDSDMRTSEPRCPDTTRCPDTMAHVYTTKESRDLLNRGVCPDPGLHDTPEPCNDSPENETQMKRDLNAELHEGLDALADIRPEKRQYPARDVELGEEKRQPPSNQRVIAEIAAERWRQIEREGWTPEHDDRHSPGTLAQAAAWYAANAAGYEARGYGELPYWPWDEEWRKPKDRRRDLIRAAALIVAEIERLDRAADVASEARCYCDDHQGTNLHCPLHGTDGDA